MHAHDYFIDVHAMACVQVLSFGKILFIHTYIVWVWTNSHRYNKKESGDSSTPNL